MKQEIINEIVEWEELKRIFEICNSTNTEFHNAKSFFPEISFIKFDQTINLLNDIQLNRPYTKENFSEELLVFILKECPDFFNFCLAQNMKKLSFSIPIRYYVMRNLLLQMEIIKKADSNYFVFMEDKYQNKVAELVKKKQRKKTLNELMEELEHKAYLGDIAEQYVLNYEQKKFPKKSIQYVSPFDVSAGYDILSFFSREDLYPRKMIEVKCVGNDYAFHISKNELETAKKNIDNYYLCLVHYSLEKEPLFIEDVYLNISNHSEMTEEGFKVLFEKNFISEIQQ